MASRRTRRVVSTVAIAAAVALLSPLAGAQITHWATGPRGSQQRMAQQGSHRNMGPQPGGRGERSEHLAQWMNQHSNLSPAEQQQALEREPGFRELPPQTQQRMRNRLTQLNAMSPQQRSRVLQRTEAMEKLTPEQRGEVRGAMQQLGALPPDQRRQVARSFRELRDLPPDQRIAAMNSEHYRGQLNDAQRATLGNLMRVEPLLPPPDKQ